MQEARQQNPTNIRDAKFTKIEDALKVLEDAAKDTSADLKDLLKDRYEDLEATLQKVFGFSTEEAVEKVKSMAGKAKESVQEKGLQINESIHDNPWTYIAGGTALGFIAGCMVARK